MNLSIKDLSMKFADAESSINIFSNVNLELSSGSRLAIVGESGVGKTTLLYLLAGLEFPSAGKISFDNINISQDIDLAEFRRENVGFIFQSHYLLPEFSAEENVALPLIMQGQSFAEAIEKAQQMLAAVGLDHRLKHRPGKLSGGEQQRVAVARAFIAEPGVIFADEPTGSLDQKTADKVLGLLLELQSQKNITLIIVTHSRELASKMDLVKELRSDGLY